MNYFANESDVQRVGDFELQNRVDRIQIGGGTITRDEAGLVVARALLAHLNQIERRLVEDRDAGKLPKAISQKQDVDVGNVFNMPTPPRG